MNSEQRVDLGVLLLMGVGLIMLILAIIFFTPWGCAGRHAPAPTSADPVRILPGTVVSLPAGCKVESISSGALACDKLNGTCATVIVIDCCPNGMDIASGTCRK